MEVVSLPSWSGSENNTKIRNDHGLHIGTPNGSHEHASEALSAARDGFTCNHDFSYPRGKQPNSWKRILSNAGTFSSLQQVITENYGGMPDRGRTRWRDL